MLGELQTPVCDADNCDRPLDEPQLVFETPGGRREAYECVCGAVTVTVARLQ
jgi:hypothetical protein